MLVHHRGAARRGILGTLLRAENRGESAGDDALHHLGLAAERRWTFARVEDAEPAGRARADVEEPAVSTKRIFGERDESRDRLTLARDRIGDGAVLGVHQVDDLDR